MKLLTLADSKRPILSFEAQDVSYSHDGASDIIIQASGSILFQDTPALEELLHSDYACLFSVTEGEETLLQGRYKITIINLEQGELVARITVGD